MAIDTLAKRIAAMDMGNETTTPGMPIPDGTIGASDRMHMVWLYSGVSAQDACLAVPRDAAGIATARPPC